MGFSKDIADRVMVKCGRNCCLCRRFKPTMLQVHHIVEKSKGGPDDEDNAIALCITCHCDVHTNRPFTLRFAAEELKQHRDHVYKMVEEGKLFASEDPIVESRFDPSASHIVSAFGLSPLAIEVLVGATEGDGRIHVSDSRAGRHVLAGDFDKTFAEGRERAEFNGAMDELDTHGLIQRARGEVYEITLGGYQIADAAMAIDGSVK